MGFKIFTIRTMYPGFLKSFYERHQDINDHSCEEHYNLLLNDSRSIKLMSPPGGGAMRGSSGRGMRVGRGDGRDGFSVGPPQETETRIIFWLKNINLTNN
jgi:hypothetical protein